MNSFDIYRTIRTWEDMRALELDMLNGRIDKDPSTIAKCREVMESMRVLLAQESTDVEYIVINTFPNLKKGGWLYNYYIEQNKIEYKDYEYTIYKGPLNGEGEKVELKTFPALTEAVTEILSYCPELEFKTVEEAVTELTIFSEK